jgi:leucyl aminopeptidase (aminopeptidase T)
MPNVLRRMERSALAADYPQIAKRTHMLAERLTKAVEADVVFSTGHRCVFDLRYRTGYADDGVCTANKHGHKLINLPSGEGFIVPYEGEKAGEPSRTAGIIPLKRWDTTLLLHVESNRITEIEGAGPEAERIRAHFDMDPARRNIAELGFGCNDQAIVTGNVLEDEKAGFHWAYGRSEHLGGTVGPDAFRDRANVVHHDIVYARGCPIGTASVVLKYPDAADELLMKDNQYCIF